MNLILRKSSLIKLVMVVLLTAFSVSQAGATYGQTGPFYATEADPTIRTNLGFSIPASATITGLVFYVTANGHAEGDTGYLRFTKNGSSGIGDNRQVELYPSQSFYSPSNANLYDLWGTTWTPAEINASTFGLYLTQGTGAPFGDNWIYSIYIFVGYRTAALTGTVTTATESDIVAGGKTIVLTLTGDTWIAAGAASFDLQRQNIINGITSVVSETFGWNSVPKALQGVTGVVRTSDTVVTITLDAFATYNITAAETITATIPATALTGNLAIVATSTFNIAANVAAPTVPGAPTIGTATAGNTTATVPFTAPASNGGSTITGYTATSNPGGLTGNGASSPVTVSGLTNGTSYTFTVYATNAIGNSSSSAASNAVTPATAPGAPTIGTANSGNGSASVAFTPPASNGGSTITGYTATSNPGGLTGNGASSPVTVSGLTNGTSYTFTVYATNAKGNSSSSAASNAVTPAIFCPSAVSGTVTISVSCTFLGTTDGVDGSITINAGKTLTINSGQTIVFNRGSSVVVNGSLVIIGNGQLKKSYLWVVDADHDGWPATTLAATEASSSPGSNYARLNTTLSRTVADCNDADAGVYQNLELYTDGDGDGYGTGSGSSVCSGASPPSGYSADNTDCNDSNGYVYQDQTITADSDQDGWSNGSGYGSACVGGSATVNGRTYYLDISGNLSILANGQALGWDDCLPLNSAKWVARAGYLDADGDNYTTGAAEYWCSGASLDTYNISTFPYRVTQTATDCNDSNSYVQTNKTAYSDGDGDGYTVAGAAQCVSASTCGANGWYSYNTSNSCSVITSAKSGTDCYDSNSYVHPGSTDFGTNRGDGSFDYNCDNVATHAWPDTMSNCFNTNDGDAACTSRGLSGTTGACQKGETYWSYMPGISGYGRFYGWHQSFSVPACGDSQYQMLYSGSPPNGVCEQSSGSGGWCYGFYLCDQNTSVLQYCN